jgi:hypothetical protein
MEDRFGRDMVTNVSERSGLALYVEYCASLESQRERLLRAGFASAAGATVDEAYRTLPKTERTRYLENTTVY